MSASAVAKGNRAKARTKRWLEAQGYAVAHMERMFFIWTPKGKIATKKDQFASDLLAIRADMPDTYIQVKLGAPSRPRTVRNFREFPFSRQHVRLWLVVWQVRGRAPRVFDLTDEVLNREESAA